MRTLRIPQPTAQSRRGTSLIEVIVLIGVSTVMLGVAVMMMHFLLRAERYSTHALWHSTTLSRLSGVLRNDIHAATGADFEPPAENRRETLRLTISDVRRVNYTIEEHRLTRTETESEKDLSRNVFYFPPGSRLRFQQASQPATLVRLVIGRPTKPVAGNRAAQTSPSNQTPPQRIIEIQAVLARDHRFQGTD